MARNLIVRTNPSFMPLRNAMDALFNDSFVNPTSADWSTVWGVGSRLPLNIYADGENYTFVALVPGVSAEELSIEAEGNTVKISGELIAPALSADEKVRTLRNEIGYGKFSRAFEMPDEIDADKIDAHLENGVLTLRVPKAEALRPRTIKVQAK
jgi:HSP20 family protein